MNSKCFIVLIGLVLGAFLAGCPETARPCDSTTCEGCCDATGACQAGESPQSCGASGNACIACRLDQLCQSGVCVPGGGEGGDGGAGCTPSTCAELGADCGTIEDGCGGFLVCGSCDVAGESCGGSGAPNVCAPGSCTPGTCTELGKTCGAVSDGCAAVLNCGSCTQPLSCGGGGVPNECGQGCVAKTCAQLGASCGSVSDGCGAMLNCGPCSMPATCGGGGTANACGQGCIAETCASRGANCGVISDGCGKMLNCGTCASPQTCGGAGASNVCGAICRGGCPSGFTCDEFGTCAEGNLSNLVLDVKVPVEYTVSGRVNRNGVRPTVTSCGNWRARLDFEHGSDARFNKSIYVEACSTVSNIFAFSGTLYPGTYKVSVSPGYNTNLPPWTSVVSTAFLVQADVSDVVFNVAVPAEYTVSGRVNRNGVRPTVTSCGNWRARLDFEHGTDARFNKSIYVEACSTVSNIFAFSGTLYPGTYKVSVSPGYNTNLPPWTSVVNTAFSVQADVSDVVFNVAVPVEYAVSGRVNRNGVRPTVTSCGNWRARLDFEHGSDARFNQSIYVEACSTVSNIFAFDGTLYPGTYKVSVTRGYNTNLPPWTTVVSTAFLVQADLANVVFDVSVPVEYTVSGRVNRNGVRPTVTSCGNWRARLDFEHGTDSRYDQSIYVEACSTVSNIFAFSGTLYPGTYKVSVTRGYNTNLPPWTSVVNTAFSVQADVSDVVFNVTVPVEYTVSGRVNRNGVRPTVTSCGNWRARLDFEHGTDSRYDQLIYVEACSTVSNIFAFSGMLYPGTYKVSVSPGYNTNLPSWKSVVSTAFLVQGDLTNLTFDVPVPPEYPVSGRVTLNGARPTVTSCGNWRARIDFAHTTDGRFDRSIYVEACSATSNVFGFSGLLYPGVYEVSVTRGYNTNLPSWTSVVVERLRVPSTATIGPGTGNVVISQIYGGGGNSGATYTHDFVELFNTGTQAVDLGGWTIQYGGGTASTWLATDLTGSIAPGRYLLVQQALGAGGTTALPTPDVVGPHNLSATSGKIALVAHADLLSGECPADPTIVDLVGYGTTNCFQGSAAAAAPSNTQSALRSGGGCAVSGDNGADFTSATPAPRNASSAANACP